MFKNFLTHQIAQGFDRACGILDFGPEASERKKKEELQHCARSMLHFLNRSAHTKDPKELQKFLFVAITYLRECREILDLYKVESFDVRGRYEVLHARLEQLCWEASKAENGQLRMLG
jgi:hypothetical protein